MEIKECTTCLQEKQVDEFYPKKHGKLGVASQCIKCMALEKSKYYLKNKESILIATNLYRKNNRASTNLAERKRFKKNKDKMAAKLARRLASKDNRTPKWLKPLDFQHIRLFYKAAKDLTNELGIKFEVDHIIPLRGEFISGLHVPSNLQVITAVENRNKSNNYDYK